MNCSQIQDLLSAYFDGELPDESNRTVTEHLESCSDCTGELAGFRNLSAMAGRFPTPPSPKSNWRQLENALDDESAVAPDRRNGHWRMSWRRHLALAATMLLVVGLGWTGYKMAAPEHKHARVFGHYLEEFQRDPARAQGMLLTEYKGEPLDAGSAIQTVGYRPAVANGLPEGYSIESTYVMEMPCCTCVQTLCKRSDGSVLVVFEHDDEQPNWFGGLPDIIANCGGMQCSLVELESQLAASWKRGKRHMTIIGARDVAEVDKMVSWLSKAGTG